MGTQPHQSIAQLVAIDWGVVIVGLKKDTRDTAGKGLSPMTKRRQGTLSKMQLETGKYKSPKLAIFVGWEEELRGIII